MMEVSRVVRSAMRRSPSGPCHDAYMAAMTASSACAVHTLLVAFSRRMCCSRVCSASRRAGRPASSTDTPTRRPGSARANSSFVAMKPACGPPKPMGTPKRCIEPTAMSAPMSAGLVTSTIESGSATTTARPPAACTRSMTGARSRTSPVVAGCASSAPKRSAGMSSMSPTSTSMPIGTARARTTSIVCGWQAASTKNTGLSALPARRAMVMASAAAVASSSREALASGSPVRSLTSVW